MSGERVGGEEFASPDPAKLVEAVKDVCWKATPMYLPDGFHRMRLMTTRDLAMSLTFITAMGTERTDP